VKYLLYDFSVTARKYFAIYFEELSDFLFTLKLSTNFSPFLTISCPLSTGNVPTQTFLGQTKPPAYWCWTVLSTMPKWGLVPSANCRCGAKEQTTNHILASCPLYHPPNETLGLATLGDDTVDWLKRTAMNIRQDRPKRRREELIFIYSNMHNSSARLILWCF